MENTPNLALPYLLASQADKHVSVNEAFDRLDQLVHISVETMERVTPPTNPITGERHIVGASSNAAWAGQTAKIATWDGDEWVFTTPQIGWLAWLKTPALLVVFTSTGWVNVQPPSFATRSEKFGINGDADSDNRLLVASPASLFNHDGAGHQLKINKATSSDAASVLFQTSYSGRAEMGIVGNDRFCIKVSPDGQNWKTALTINHQNGEVLFPLTQNDNSPQINCLSGAGRFVSESEASSVNLVSTFIPIPALAPYNGATFTGHGKMIYDNSTYGGTNEALNADVDELISKIRDPNRRRWQSEFWVAAITCGTGINVQTPYQSTLYALSVYLRKLHGSAMTIRFLLRAKTGNTLVHQMHDGQVITIDGQPTPPGHILITPAMGWVSVLIQDRLPARMSIGYQPDLLYLSQAEAGDVALIALPALMFGIHHVDPDEGIIPSFAALA